MKANAMTDNGHRLVIDQFISAPRQDVFDAWTTASEVRQWWRPPGGSCSEATIDLRVGGRYLIRNELADGSTVTIEGEFLEINEPESLTYSWSIDPASPHRETVVVQFEDHPVGTTVSVTHSRIQSDLVAKGHRVGWDSCLSSLVSHLTGEPLDAA